MMKKKKLKKILHFTNETNSFKRWKNSKEKLLQGKCKWTDRQTKNIERKKENKKEKS